MTGHRAAVAALVLAVTLGVALHLYAWNFLTEGGFGAFEAAMLAWSVSPYVFAAVIGWHRRLPQTAWLGALLALGFDSSVHHAVFIAPTSSTAGVSLLFAPQVSLFLVALGTAIGYGLWRWWPGRASPRQSPRA